MMTVVQAVWALRAHQARKQVVASGLCIFAQQGLRMTCATPFYKRYIAVPGKGGQSGRPHPLPVLANDGRASGYFHWFSLFLDADSRYRLQATILTKDH